jgi:hypothetical protein
MAPSQRTPLLHSLQVAYLRLGPGQRHYQDTYTTHPWISREVHTGRRMMLGDSMVRYQALRLRGVATIQSAAMWLIQSAHSRCTLRSCGCILLYELVTGRAFPSGWP